LRIRVEAQRAKYEAQLYETHGRARGLSILRNALDSNIEPGIFHLVLKSEYSEHECLGTPIISMRKIVAAGLKLEYVEAENLIQMPSPGHA
jgi:hypothetical protein